MLYLLNHHEGHFYSRPFNEAADGNASAKFKPPYGACPKMYSDYSPKCLVIPQYCLAKKESVSGLTHLLNYAYEKPRYLNE